jgi:hypothetical protein
MLGTGVCPVTPLRQTLAVKRGDLAPRVCKHGEWRVPRRRVHAPRDEMTLPDRRVKPRSAWVKPDRLHPLIPRHTGRSKALYSSRGAIAREFGRLKDEWSMLPLRVRGIGRVRLRADVTILPKLGCALGKMWAAGA